MSEVVYSFVFVIGFFLLAFAILFVLNILRLILEWIGCAGGINGSTNGNDRI